MTRIKICGITNREDALAAVSLGADALGFIGVPSSPRYIEPSAQIRIAELLPPFVSKVAVLRRVPLQSAMYCDFTQYYEDGDGLIPVSRDARGKPGHYLSPSRYIRCFRVKDESSLAEIESYPSDVAAILLDTYHQDMLGGSGETFHWDLAVEAKRRTDRPLILAGGLTPENVADALEAVRPHAVDVASGVESAPGVKDHAKMRAFIRAVRAWDARRGGD